MFILTILEAAPTVTIRDGALESVYVLWRHRNHRCIIIIIYRCITGKSINITVMFTDQMDLLVSTGHLPLLPTVINV